LVLPDHVFFFDLSVGFLAVELFAVAFFFVAVFVFGFLAAVFIR